LKVGGGSKTIVSIPTSKLHFTFGEKNGMMLLVVVEKVFAYQFV